MTHINSDDKDSINLQALFSLFQQSSAELLATIKQDSTLRSYPDKATIFIKDEPLKNIFLIIHGTIHVIKDDSEGKAQIISILRRGDFFPHIGLFENSLTPGNAYTTEETQLLLIPIQLFREIALQHPEILMEYSKVLAKKIIELQSRLEEKAFCSTYEQVTRRLLFLAERYGKKSDSEFTELTISLTHEELAHLVGTSRETVSRSITKLKKNNALQIKKGSWLLNIANLRKLD